MIVEQTLKEIVSSESFERKGYEVVVDETLFRILTDIYTDKISSIIREVGCNARDSHILNNQELTPIEITLPNNLEPVFIVRDFGPGLSKEDVFNVFCVYNKSLKRNIENAIGYFGIGAKSPFTYCPSFQIVSRFDGRKMIFNAFRGENGQPQIAMMSNEECFEPSGLEIFISVKQEDVFAFQNKLKEVCAFWTLKPTVKGVKDFTFDEIKWHLKKDGSWGFPVYKSHYSRESKIVMGGVQYSLDAKNISQLPEIHKKILEKGIVLFAKMGEISVPPPRETVEYTEKTINFVKNRLAKVEAEIKASIESKMGSINSEYEARKFWYDLFQEQGELNIVKDIIKGIIDIKFNGIVIGSPCFDAPFSGYKLEYYLDKQYNRRVSCRDVPPQLHIISYNNVEKLNVFESLFVDFGDKGRGKLRNYARYWLNENEADDEEEIIVLQPTDQKEFEEWLTKTGIPPEFFHNLDEVVKLPPKAKVVKDKVVRPEGFNCWVFDPEDNCESKYDGEEIPDENCRFEYANIDFDEDEPGYYVVRYGKHIPYLNNSEYFRALKDLDKKFAKNPVIHIITSRYVDKCSKAGWIEVGERLKELIQAKWDSFKLDSIYYSWLSDFSYGRGVALHSLKNDKKIKSDLVNSFFKLIHFDGMDHNKFDYRSIGSHLGCVTPNLESDIGRIEKEAGEIWKKILDTAPLMNYIDSDNYEKPEVLAYLQEKLNNK